GLPRTASGLLAILRRCPGSPRAGVLLRCVSVRRRRPCLFVASEYFAGSIRKTLSRDTGRRCHFFAYANRLGACCAQWSRGAGIDSSLSFCCLVSRLRPFAACLGAGSNATLPALATASAPRGESCDGALLRR